MTQQNTRTVRRMREFNRYYTEIIGALDDRHEGLDLTLAEARCLFTVDHLGRPDIGQIADRLQLDLGYVSRLVSRLERSGRVGRARGQEDGRRRLVSLTADGAALLAEVVRRSDARMSALTSHLSRAETSTILDAMDTIQNTIQPRGT